MTSPNQQGPISAEDMPNASAFLLANVLSDSPPLRWLIATVSAVDTVNKSATVNINGGTVSKVSYLKSAVPAINDVVHILIHPANGMLIFGIEELRPADPEPPAPTITTVNPTSADTYQTDPLPAAWIGAPARQGPVRSGAFFYPGGSFTGVGVDMASVQIQVQVATPTPLALVLHNNTAAVGAFAPVDMVFMVEPTEETVLQWIDLPLYWAALLADGTAKGIGLASSVYESTVIAGGTLRFTPLV